MKAALWLRVSTEEQTTENQRLALEELAQRRELEVVKCYDAVASGFKGQHLKQLSQVYDDARLGRWEYLLVWSLDRLTREGPLATLQVVDRLAKYGATVVSHQEWWAEVDGPFRELLLSLTGWIARQESERRSERIKAGLARRKAEGKPVGRQKGATDNGRRRRSGYFTRYEK